MAKSVRVADETGPPCPRCGHDTEVRTHAEITEKLLRQPCYYSKWFYCRNPECKTTMLMPKKFLVLQEAPVYRPEPIRHHLVPADGKPPWED